MRTYKRGSEQKEVVVLTHEHESCLEHAVLEIMLILEFEGYGIHRSTDKEHYNAYQYLWPPNALIFCFIGQDE